MKIKQDWERNIIEITNIIQRDYPELVKYISEMRISNLQDQEVNAHSLEEYYNSLKEIISRYGKASEIKIKNEYKDDIADVYYPIYPPSEDIYQQSKEITEIDPADLSKRKTLNEQDRSMNEKSFSDDMAGDDLDVPGSELDDQLESVGSEDEENNYYSLGGDSHNDLDENNG